ncbi:hypothetical protein GCM10020221_27020 [Streptomyces thioluteus]|uniref:Small hydrophobic protein n=1 Tax=Streptomyces thioluteus TaxID=66431 RepID=A0ABN3WZ60_STRTU
MSDTVEPIAAHDTGSAAAAKKTDIEDRTPRGIVFRAFVYLVAVHFIAGFFFLLFYLGGG